MVLTALFGALVCVATLIPHIPVGMQGGYIHVGDTFIYLAASVLPLPYAMIASAIGAGLADFFSGAAIYVIPTLIIKPLMAACFTNKSSKLLNKRNIIAVFAAGIICIAGYYLAESIIFGSFITPLLAIPLGVLQPISSGILYLLIAKLIGEKRITIN